MSDFEDPSALARCIKSDCDAYRAGNTPFCAQHLREQEIKSPGIVEPDVEARVARVRTEDDDHPGMVKVYDKETGEPSWVPAEEGDPRLARPPRLYVGPDPDTVDIYTIAKPGSVPGYNGQSQSDPGVWVAATTTRVVIFDNELEALRYAVANQTRAEFVPFNTELQLPQ